MRGVRWRGDFEFVASAKGWALGRLLLDGVRHLQLSGSPCTRSEGIRYVTAGGGGVVQVGVRSGANLDPKPARMLLFQGRLPSDNELMTESETIRLWAQTWKQCGTELERIRLREVRDEDQALAIRHLARAFNYATRTQAPDDSSGLIEMQRYFAKLRR